VALVEEGLRARLAGFAGLSALVSTRIYRLTVPQDAVLPAVTYQRISGPREYVMGQQTPLVRARFQITSWADDYSGVKAVAEQVRLALSNYAGTSAGVVIDWVEMVNDTDLFEDETGQATGVFGVASDFFLHYREVQP